MSTPVTTDPATRRRDLRILAVTAALVLAAGSLIAWGMTRVGSNAAEECGEQRLGDAGSIRNDEDLTIAPRYVYGGPGCDFWLLNRDDELIAVRGRQEALKCVIRPRPNEEDPSIEEWPCNGEVVPLDELTTYPLSVKDFAGAEDTLVVQLTPVGTDPD